MRGYQTVIDMGLERDYGVMTIFRRPNRLELFLRKIGLSKAKWEWKIIHQERIK
jgi:hypothetical protein